MKRDLNLFRNILIFIEKNSEPGVSYPIINYFNELNSDYKTLYEHIKLMIEAGLLSGSNSNVRITNYGYDLLENIRNDKVWENTNKEIKKQKIPQTIENIFKIAGIFVGEILNRILKD